MAGTSSSRSSDLRLGRAASPASVLCLPGFPVADLHQRAAASALTAAVPSGILTRLSIIPLGGTLEGNFIKAILLIPLRFVNRILARGPALACRITIHIGQVKKKDEG